MCSLPHFCRICLKYDKNLIDLAHIENEPNETLMSKLQFCASEVEWPTYKPLLCHPCIKRLNIAYYFKKECLQSANVLKSYLQLLKESQQKGQNQNAEGEQSGAYMLLPNQKYLKILVGSQNQNSFQNVFLNVVPPTNSPGTPTPAPVVTSADSPNPNNKDSNQNIFLNINNIFKKYVPIAPNEVSKANSDKNNLNVSQLLTNSKTEELSVEIDPTDYGLVDEGDTSPDEVEHDWEDLITHSKINSDVSISRVSSNKSTGGAHKRERDDTKKSLKSVNNYVPILPKRGGVAVDEDKMEYFDAGQHFLSFSQVHDRNSREYSCESCQRTFPQLVDLKSHLKQFHMGKLPYKCKYCYIEFATRAAYELCMKFHKEQEGINNSLTLEDFANGSNENDGKATSTPQQSTPTAAENENGDFECDVCKRVFASSTGLLRHKVRKHNQKNKKKYFIKGMKNAQCDICKREFSTQSYMQLHRKLHMRDVTGYKYKVFGRNKYQNEKQEGKKGKPKIDATKEECVEPDNNEAETIDCTPDIICKSEGESEEDDEKDISGPADEEMADVIVLKDTDNGENTLQNGTDMDVETPESVELYSTALKNCKGSGQITADQIKCEEITIEEMSIKHEDK